jgi:hypothetical protein
MMDLLKVLLLPVLAALGWWIQLKTDRLAGRLSRWAATGILSLWLLDALTGIFSGTLPLHRALSHGAVVAAWIAAPIAAGIFLQKALDTGDTPSGLGAIASALVIPTVLFTATTGFLGPTRAATTQHSFRFVFLHILLAPALVTALLIAWLFLARMTTREP